jgi:hypothetical protein
MRSIGRAKIDMGADQLYDLAREQAGEWGPERFAAWMAEHGVFMLQSETSVESGVVCDGLPRRIFPAFCLVLLCHNT